MRRFGLVGFRVVGAALVLFVVLAGPVLGCVGDCNRNGIVSVDELVKGINVALGTLALQACEAIDANGDEVAAVDELVTGVDKSMNGCIDGPTGEVLLAADGSELRVLDLARGLDDVLIPSARNSVGGQACALPDATGNFAVADSSGAPGERPGWGIFDADGRRLKKLPLPERASEAQAARPMGCAFDASGRLFASAAGAGGTSDGQLIVFFPPHYDAACILDDTLGGAGGIATDASGNVYVPESTTSSVTRFGVPFPTAPALCASYQPHKSTFISFDLGEAALAPSAVAQGPNGHWFVASSQDSLTVSEHAEDGEFLRYLFDPSSGGTPSGVAVGFEGSVYYSDLGEADSSGSGVLPNTGTIRRVAFNGAGAPARPEILLSGIDVPSGVAIVPRPPESTTYGRSLRRLFYDPDEKVINRDSATGLIPRWRYTTGAIVTGSPVIAWVRLPEEGPTRVVYGTSWDGNLYALRLHDGTRLWQFTTKPHPGATYPHSSSPTVEWLGNRRVVYVGGGMTMYAVDAATGEEIWEFDAGTGCTTCDARTERNQVESSPAVYDGLVYFGMDINDSGPGKGGLFAVRADDGRLAWYFDLETGATCRPLAGDNIRRFDGYHTAEELGLPEDFLSTRPGCDFDRRGTACGNVWSSASIDPERRLLYIASSNCDTDDDPESIPPPPPMPPYDRALFAVTLDGDPAWAWRPDEVDNDDLSFGGVPNLFTIDFEGQRREVVGIGNKNGTYYVIDRDGVNEVNGVTAQDPPEIRNRELPYWQTNVVPGGSIGGIIASAAVNEDERKVFFGTAIGLDLDHLQFPAAHALNLDDGSIAWENPDVPPSYAPTAAVRGLAFIGTIATAVINIFDSDDGTVINSIDSRGQLGGAASVPAIAGGMLTAGGGVGEFGVRPGSQDCDVNPFTAYCQGILDKPISVFCVSGTLGCEARQPCDDGNVCTYDYRGDDGACRSEPAPNTLECTSGDTKGVCQDGACAVSSP